VHIHHKIGLGANAAPGDIRYVDVNGDNIDAKDRTNLGIRFQKRRWIQLANEL
jgi:hypothetical protein